MKVCAEFCKDQSRALELLRAKQRGNKDQRLSQILQVMWHIHAAYKIRCKVLC